MNIPGLKTIFHADHFIVVTIICVYAVCPVTAGTQYLYGSPNLSVSVSGVNDFSPGDDISIPVVIVNTGVNEYKYVYSSIADRDDLPNTAKLLVVALSPGKAPITIKSDPQMAGDLAGERSVIVTFYAKVDSDAAAGTYQLPVNLTYSYLWVSEQFGTDAMLYTYKTVNTAVTVSVTIKPHVMIDVIEAEPENLNVGTRGYLNITIRNTGSEDGRKTSVRIVRSGNSPIIPSDSSVYIGDFPSGSTASCRYKASVASDAEPSTYPLDILAEYENNDGDMVTSSVETVGIPVGRKTEFAIISSPVEIHPGQKEDIEIEYKNTGSAGVYSAQGRICVVEPFTSSDDIVYLGDIGPGESIIASYRVSVDKTATIKYYGLDSEIRYQDETNTTYISNTMKVEIDVTKQQGAAAVLADPILMSFIFTVVIMILYGAYRYRKKET